MIPAVPPVMGTLYAYLTLAQRYATMNYDYQQKGMREGHGILRGMMWPQGGAANLPCGV